MLHTFRVKRYSEFCSQGGAKFPTGGKTNHQI